MAGASSSGWRAGLREIINFLNGIVRHAGVSPLKSAAAPGPSFVSGSWSTKNRTAAPSAADDSAGCFYRHRRNEVRDRFVANGAPSSTPISDPSSKPPDAERSAPSTLSASRSKVPRCRSPREPANQSGLSNYVRIHTNLSVGGETFLTGDSSERGDTVLPSDSGLAVVA